MKRCALIIAALLMLAGCGKDKLDGDVTSKQVKPGYTYLYMMPITSCSGGKTSVCTTTYIPIYYSVPTCYQLHVKGTVSGDTCVSEGKWEATDIGDSYVGPDADPKDAQRKVSGKANQ